MSKFKVGDKVRCKSNPDATLSMHLGNVYTVTRTDGEFLELMEAPASFKFNWNYRNFELVASAPQTELEQLVATANAGMAAYRELYEMHNDKVEINYAGENGTGELGPLISSPILEVPRTITIKQEKKPEFTPFKIKEGYTVHAYEHKGYIRVDIGCSCFSARDLRITLHALLVGNRPYHGNIYATVKGPRREPTGEGISWESAKQIYEALDKYIGELEC